MSIAVEQKKKKDENKPDMRLYYIHATVQSICRKLAVPFEICIPPVDDLPQVFHRGVWFSNGMAY